MRVFRDLLCRIGKRRADLLLLRERLLTCVMPLTLEGCSHGCQRLHPCLLPLLISRGLIGPVSYTHLDVYKRQALESATISVKRSKAHCAPPDIGYAEDLDY